ncbi:MAG: efflux RND transporter periplasmic adaptor subunit [Bacteroidaceae bacterium]|nr:efflux RND transporter periplasmic adaptor subunit [Bacteroidaceae bacterium]
MRKLYFLLLLQLFFANACTEKRADEKNVSDNQEQQAPTRVKTEVVTSKPAESGQTYVGIVEESEATAVSFTNMGVVKRLLVNEGQFVSKGQLLAEMDDTQARNMLSGAEAQMTQANDALERYGMLHENGSLPEVQWVEIQSKVAQAKSQLEIAKKNLADCRLTAPVSGIIGNKQVGAGETAMPSQAVVNILNINKVKVKVAIPETEINGISTNSPSYIKVDAINQSFNGGLIEKGVQADALTHTYDVRINVLNSERLLLPGMVASVSFTLASQQTADTGLLTLPVTSVQKRANGSLFVWVIDKDNRVHRTEVSVGKTMGNRIAITSGISLNQRVVTEGYQKLSEGTKVIF